MTHWIDDPCYEFMLFITLTTKGHNIALSTDHYLCITWSQCNYIRSNLQSDCNFMALVSQAAYIQRWMKEVEVIVQALAAIINYSSVTYLSKHLCLCCYLSTLFLPWHLMIMTLFDTHRRKIYGSGLRQCQSTEEVQVFCAEQYFLLVNSGNIKDMRSVKCL